MDSMDEDMFALSDEELPIAISKCNPVEEHLMKQLSDVQIRIEKTKGDINDVQDMIKCTLKSLYSQARYGKDITSNTDSDLYTIDGEPVVKKTKHKDTSIPLDTLVIKSSWKHVVFDKWVIGIILMNTSIKILTNVQVYVSFKQDVEFGGSSMIWELINETFWNRTNKIAPNKQAVATVVLDLPKFEKEPYCDVYGTVLYNMDEKQFQTPLPVIHFTVHDATNNTYQLKIPPDTIRRSGSTSVTNTVLTLKSISVEKTIDARFIENLQREKEFLTFLVDKSFQEICPDVYVADGCLTHCMIEILRVIEDQKNLRIFARSGQQMNIVLRLLRDQFPDINIEEGINPLRAAMALMEELKSYQNGDYLDGNASTTEQQMARIRTDLLIP